MAYAIKSNPEVGDEHRGPIRFSNRFVASCGLWSIGRKMLADRHGSVGREGGEGGQQLDPYHRRGKFENEEGSEGPNNMETGIGSCGSIRRHVVPKGDDYED